MSRDVIFYEKVFPFHNTNLIDIQIDPFETIPIPIVTLHDIPTPETVPVVVSGTEKDCPTTSAAPSHDSLHRFTEKVIPEISSADDSEQRSQDVTV